MANPYKLKRFEQASLSATQTNWQKQCERHPNDLIPTEYERILKWTAENAIYEKARETFAYGVFEGDSHTASAVLEVLYPKAGRRWLKQLDLHLAPSLDLSFYTDNVDLEAIGNIFGAGVAGVLRLTADHPAKEVKLYGRSGTLLTYLKGLAAKLEGNPAMKDFRITVEGRWLVFRAR
jgi:hypothetical protein